jgi:hypothetical protein
LESLKGRDLLEDLGIDIKQTLKTGWEAVDWIYFAEDQLVGSCEHSNESSDSIKPLVPNGNYISHVLQQSINLHFVFMGFI